jgi:hypothetical protein
MPTNGFVWRHHEKPPPKYQLSRERFTPACQGHSDPSLPALDPHAQARVLRVVPGSLLVLDDAQKRGRWSCRRARSRLRMDAQIDAGESLNTLNNAGLPSDSVAPLSTLPPLRAPRAAEPAALAELWRTFTPTIRSESRYAISFPSSVPSSRSRWNTAPPVAPMRARGGKGNVAWLDGKGGLRFTRS